MEAEAAAAGDEMRSLPCRRARCSPTIARRRSSSTTQRLLLLVFAAAALLLLVFTVHVAGNEEDRPPNRGRRHHRHHRPRHPQPYLPDRFFVPLASDGSGAAAAQAAGQPADVLALNGGGGDVDADGKGDEGGSSSRSSSSSSIESSSSKAGASSSSSASSGGSGGDDPDGDFAGVPAATDILPPPPKDPAPNGEMPGDSDEGALESSLPRASFRDEDPTRGVVRVVHKQLLARSPSGAVVRSDDLGFDLPQPWDPVNLTEVLVDNLAPMARFWRVEAPRRPRVRDIFVNALNATHYRQSDTHRVVAIRANVVTFPLMPPGPKQRGCDEDCNPQLAAWVDAMAAAVRIYGLRLPDVVFSLSVQDGGGRCLRDQWDALPECVVPSLSVSQFELATDLLAPMMLLPDSNVTWRHARWASKSDRAFFRGVPSCGEMPREPGVCARTAAARLAAERPELFDAGLVEPHPARTRGEMDRDPALKGAARPLPVVPRARRNELALHKYLLNLDGHSAAYRFAVLLATNSLVLKQHSRHLEWYYRSVHPGEHYLPIFADARDDAVKQLEWAAAHPDGARAIARRANRFALTYTTYYARVLYWVYALKAYRGLFADQDEYFETRGAGVQDVVLAVQSSLAAEARRKRAEAAERERMELERAEREERTRRQDQEEEVIGSDWRRRRRRRSRRRRSLQVHDAGGGGGDAHRVDGGDIM